MEQTENKRNTSKRELVCIGHVAEFCRLNKDLIFSWRFSRDNRSWEKSSKIFTDRAPLRIIAVKLFVTYFTCVRRIFDGWSPSFFRLLSLFPEILLTLTFLAYFLSRWSTAQDKNHDQLWSLILQLASGLITFDRSRLRNRQVKQTEYLPIRQVKQTTVWHNVMSSNRTILHREKVLYVGIFFIFRHFRKARQTELKHQNHKVLIPPARRVSQVCYL